MTEIVNRNVVVNGRRSSMRLEPDLWDAFRAVCIELDVDHVELMKRIMAGHTGGTRTSTVRTFLLNHYRTKAEAPAKAA